jgi:hypothetical protein
MKEQSESRMERDCDSDVARVLGALGKATPPAYLEQRVLASLARRADTKVAASTSEARASHRRAFSWAAAGLAAALVLTSAVMIKQAAHRRGTNVFPENATMPAARAVPPAEDAAVPPGPTKGASAAFIRPRTAASVFAPVSAGPETREPGKPAASTLDASACRCDPVALAEANAPSHPAPPIPLTREEKRILRVLHDGQYQQLAELDPARRERELVQSRAEFDAYFPTPPPPAAEPEEGTDKP